MVNRGRTRSSWNMISPRSRFQQAAQLNSPGRLEHRASGAKCKRGGSGGYKLRLNKNTQWCGIMLLISILEPPEYACTRGGWRMGVRVHTRGSKLSVLDRLSAMQLVGYQSSICNRKLLLLPLEENWKQMEKLYARGALIAGLSLALSSARPALRFQREFKEPRLHLQLTRIINCTADLPSQGV